MKMHSSHSQADAAPFAATLAASSAMLTAERCGRFCFAGRLANQEDSVDFIGDVCNGRSKLAGVGSVRLCRNRERSQHIFLLHEGRHYLCMSHCERIDDSALTATVALKYPIALQCITINLDLS